MGCPERLHSLSVSHDRLHAELWEHAVVFDGPLGPWGLWRSIDN